MLYITRHGETTWNAQGLVCGHADIELTEKVNNKQKNSLKKLQTWKYRSPRSYIPLCNAQEIWHKR